MKKIDYGKQCTIIWNVDNIKISHVDSNIVSSVLAYIDTEYGKISKMTITQVKIHKYLRMTIDYSLPGKVKFSIVNCIGNILNYTPEGMKGESSTPAAHHIFYIDKDATKLS